MSEKCESCEKRRRERSDGELKRLCNRLCRIEGQIRGIRGMLDRDAYCMDILAQTAAARAALNAFSRELISQHLMTCVADELREGGTDKAQELCDMLTKLMK